VDEDTFMLMHRLDTLQLGRYKGRIVNLFENPEFGRQTHRIADTIRGLPDNTALELIRRYNIGAIAMVMIVPPSSSLIFFITWISVFAGREGSDKQVIVGTAFTAASYIVTTGCTPPYP